MDSWCFMGRRDFGRPSRELATRLIAIRSGSHRVSAIGIPLGYQQYYEAARVILLIPANYFLRLSGTHMANVACMRYAVCVWPWRRRYVHKARSVIERRCESVRFRFHRAEAWYRIENRAVRFLTVTANHLGVGGGVLPRRCIFAKNSGVGAKRGRGTFGRATLVYSASRGIARSDCDAVRVRNSDLNPFDAGVGRYRAHYGSAKQRTYKFVPEFR